MHTTYTEAFLPNAEKILDIRTLFIWYLMDGVTILFQLGVCKDLQYYQTPKKNPLCVHVEVLHEMNKSSDPQILGGSPGSPSHLRGCILQFPPPTLKFTSAKQF